ncbi:hypothetical protein BC830DRAFT_256665 [Chytriomyces sp. MP71]|nr:hypothetical protein BC830DRAFT_256665 [Chytriomyces sp. MP71]
MEVSKTQCSFLSELNTFEPSIAMLSATQSSEEDERYLGMTNTVRDGLLVFDGEGVKAGDLDRSAHADATNSTNTNAGDICGELLRKTRALGIALGRQQQRRRRTSVFSLGSDPASRLGCHPVLAHISPDTRAIVESLSDAASAHPTLLVRAVLHARDSRRLFAGLLEIVRDCEPDSRLLAHALEIALVLVRDRNLRSQLASLNAIDVVAPKVHVARENQSLILRFLEVATKHSTTSTMIATSSPETKSLVSFLQNHMLSL